jgi:hypothetical protein
MNTLESLAPLVRDMVAAQEKTKHEAEDAAARTAARTLKGFGLTPKGWGDALSERQKAAAALTKAKAELATATAAHIDAVVNVERIGSAHHAELTQLRKDAIAPWRLQDALARLDAAFDTFRADPRNWPIAGTVLPPFFDAQNFLRGLREGCADPPDDLDAYVSDALAQLAERTAAATQEHDALVRTSDKQKRTRRIFT